MKPYFDIEKNGAKVRTFVENVDPIDLKWHRDAEDRWVRAIGASDWKLQLDNQLPVSLTEEVFIPAGEWHRLIKGTDELKVSIRAGKKLFESQGASLGYRSGAFNPSEPAELLSSKGIGIVSSRVGLLGSGYYFVGSPQTAEEIGSEVGHGGLSVVDLKNYNLYRPSDPEAFYENLRDLTKYFNDATKESLSDPRFKSNFDDAVEAFSEYLELDEDSVRKTFVDYLRDVLLRHDGVLLSNRLLAPMGYDGIDLTQTQLDHFGVGSLIFAGKLKDGTYRQLLEEKKKINPAYLTRDAKKMRSEISKHAKKSDDDSSAYTSHEKGGWKADYSKSGKKYKTKPSKYTLAYQKKFGK